MSDQNSGTLEANNGIVGSSNTAGQNSAVGTAQTDVLKQLADHEQKAVFNENAQIQVVTNDAERKAQEDLAGLVFEGENEKIIGVGNTVADQVAVLPSLDLEAAKTPEVKVEKPVEKNEKVEEKAEEKVDENSQVVATKPEKEPSWLTNLSNYVSGNLQTGKIALAQEKKAEIPKAESSALSPLTNLVEKGKSELAKAKIAGLEEADRKLEDIGKKPEEIKAEQAPDAKKLAAAEAEERKKLIESERIYQEGMASIRDLIAPSAMEIEYSHIRVDGMFARTFMVFTYPRYLDANWLSPVVNLDITMDIAQFIYPIESAKIMRVLSRKVTQMQASMNMNNEKGLIRDPALETALEDAEQLRTEIQRGQEKFFQFGLYITIYSDDLKKIDQISKQMESILGSRLVLTKRADMRMEHGFNSTLPMGLDELEVFRNMNTGPLSTSFPFTSSDLTSNDGVLYGLNRHNDSLVIFDRFSLPNANSVVFAISGAGKSYTVKLEILRYLMLGVDVIVIDPENEYEALTRTVGGSYLKVSLTSERRINPFDLPAPLKDEELQPGDLLRSNIITLHGLLKIMLGGLTPLEEGLLDKALLDVYALKGVTMDVVDPSGMPVPTMEDLHALVINMDGGQEIAQRLEKFTKGTYSGIFNKPTNVDMKSGLMVFSIRDLDDSLRPIAMYIILNYIWNRVRSSLKKRLLIVDEAWTMMQHEDSAKFLFGLVKRARKYYLGITTITQDVEDFIKSPYGKPIVTNSAMQLLLKQSPASINTLQKVFNLTEGEKYMLLNSGVGQGLFFAGLKHVAMQIIASYTEDKIITTNPEEILKNQSDVTDSLNNSYV